MNTTSSCSTSCYSTVTGCSATGRTVTSMATGTTSAQLCGQSCSLCNARPLTAATPAAKRDWPIFPDLKKKRSVEMQSGIDKRVLPVPSDPPYNGDVTAFLLDEYAWATWVPLRRDPNHPSSALARQLNNQRLDLAVDGLYGCTSVVVISTQGVWISHFWEGDSFVPDRFQKDVLDAMDGGDGTPDMPGIRQYTGFRGQFNQAEVPRTIIITPRMRASQTPGVLEFRAYVDQIKERLQHIIPSSTPIVIDYVARFDEISQTQTASGKVLFQYDPTQSWLPDPRYLPACTPMQQATVRLWVEDRPQPVYAYKLDRRGQSTDCGTPEKKRPCLLSTYAEPSRNTTWG